MRGHGRSECYLQFPVAFSAPQVACQENTHLGSVILTDTPHCQQASAVQTQQMLPQGQHLQDLPCALHPVGAHPATPRSGTS